MLAQISQMSLTADLTLDGRMVVFDCQSLGTFQVIETARSCRRGNARSDFQRSGLTEDESLEVVCVLRSEGVDFVEVRRPATFLITRAHAHTQARAHTAHT